MGTPLRIKIDDDTSESVFTGQSLIYGLGGDKRVAGLLDQLGQVYNKEKAAEFSRIQTAIAKEEARKMKEETQKKRREADHSRNAKVSLGEVTEGLAVAGAVVGFAVSATLMAPVVARVLNGSEKEGYGAAKTYIAVASGFSLLSTVITSGVITGIQNIYTEGWFALSAASTIVGFGTAAFHTVRQAAYNFVERRRSAERLERIRQAFCSSEEPSV